MLTTVVAWSLLVGFLVLQRVMRRGEQARSLQALPADRGSTRLLGAAFGLGFLALAAAPALNACGVATLDLEGAAGWVIPCRVHACRAESASPGQHLSVKVCRGDQKTCVHGGTMAIT
jgi:hypothetical protein